MKLVDILARELKVWPEGYNSLQQSFAGMVFHGAKDGILPIVCLSVAEDFRTAAVTRAQWQAAVDALNAGKEFVPYDFSGPVLDYGPKEWTGEGLPPVGTVCWYGEEMEEMRIVAHVDQGAQSGDARFLAVGQAGNMGHLRLAVAEYWRPTRTPEQIAAEEREKAAYELASHVAGYMGKSEPNPEVIKIAGYLYDQGYRLQVTE